MIVEFLCSVLI